MCSTGAPPAGAANVSATRPAATAKQACRGGEREADNRGFRWIGFWNVTLADLPEASIRVGTWRNGGTPRRSFTYGSFCQNKRKHQRCEVILVRCHQERLRTPQSETAVTLGSRLRTLADSNLSEPSVAQIADGISCRLLFLLPFQDVKGSSCADCPPDLLLLLFTTL